MSHIHHFPWHQNAIDHIKLQLAESRMPHATLYRQRHDYFDSTLGWRIAQLILCDTRQGDDDCRHCRLVCQQTHPNVLFLDVFNHKVGIDAIRTLEQQMWQTSVFDKPKIAYISGIDLLSTAAQNALLKTLEEPPQNTFFILSVENISRVLTTIMSRVQRLQHKSADTHDVLHYLQSQLSKPQTEAAIAKILQLADGAPARALTLLSSTEATAALEQEKNQFIAFMAGNIHATALMNTKLLNANDKSELREKLIRYCHYNESMIRFLFAKSVRAADKTDKNPVQYPTWKGVSLRSLYRLHDKLTALRRLADTNVNMALQLTTSLTDWQHERTK